MPWQAGMPTPLGSVRREVGCEKHKHTAQLCEGQAYSQVRTTIPQGVRAGISTTA